MPTRSPLPALALAILLAASIQNLHAVSCPVTHPDPPSDADKALLAAHYSDAETAYRTALSAHPGDVHAITGLVHALLHQQKVQEAADALNQALPAAPQNAALIALRGEIEFRQGAPWDAATSALEAEKIDTCNPRAHLLAADIARLSSLYATSQKEIRLAHQLDPSDPEIREEWLMTLSLKQRIPELQAYLQQPTGDDPDDIRRLHMTLEHWQKLQVEPHPPCRLVSDVTATEVPMTKIMYSATRMRAFGLDVKLNNRDVRLEIDTGAGGLLVTRSLAQKAGLKAFSQNEVGGIGGEGDKPAYTAYADSIRIGGLEFQNCAVEVLDSKHGLEDIDGLIGMDVLSRFLVTLDYPMRKIVLSPLPPRPGEAPSAKPELKTGDTAPDESEETADTSHSQQTAAPPAQPGQDKPPPPTPAATVTTGPSDRYIAPEMKDYVKVFRVGHNLILPAALNSTKIRLFIMDTGAWATIVSPQAAREVTKVHTDSSGMEVRGIGGKVEKIYTADSITFRFANLSQKVDGAYAFDTANISKNLGLEVSGFLGATTLDLLTIYIDYRDGLVKFDYNPNRGYRF